MATGPMLISFIFCAVMICYDFDDALIGLFCFTRDLFVFKYFTLQRNFEFCVNQFRMAIAHLINSAFQRE